MGARQKRAKNRKKETRLCVRRTFDVIISYNVKKSYKKSEKKVESLNTLLFFDEEGACRLQWNRICGKVVFGDKKRILTFK